MKRLMFVLVILILSSCNNSDKTIKWIESNEKPIICKFAGMNEFGKRYTLLSASGKIYNTGMVKLELPDTIN